MQFNFLPLLVISGIVLLMITSPAYAACPSMMPREGFSIIPDDDTQVFLSYSEKDRIETLIILPAFSGTATEFGMVMPIPDRPEINEASEELFTYLDSHTNQFSWDGDLVPPLERSLGLSAENSVKIIEQKDVGDFETTVLTAENAKDLVDWLNGHKYQFSEMDEKNFEYYIQKGGYYFVAMKVNMDKATVDEDGNINGKLSPIEFIFSSEQPMLPFRIMAHDMEPMSMTLYTLAEFPYYVPGVNIIFNNKLPEKTNGYNQELDKYDPENKWLVRMNIDFDPRTIEKNLILEKIETLSVGSKLIKINPHLLPVGSGIIKGDARENFLVKNFVETMSPREQVSSGIPSESVQCKEDFQLMLRADGENTACITELNTTLLLDRGWQMSTAAAEQIERIS